MNSSLEGRDIISTKDLTREDIHNIFNVTEKFDFVVQNRTKINLLSDKVMASLFFQPSTRTRLSFESAMQRLGGSVIGWADPKVSRAGDAFKETIEDTARMIDLYADIAVIRHFQAGVPAKFAEYVDIPVINGGDGHGAYSEHPTQALGDIYTIWREKGKVDGLTIAMIGDLTGRVQHSLGYALALYDDVKVYLISPRELALPVEVEEILNKMGLDYEEVSGLEDVIGEVDVIHLTGVRSTTIHSASVMEEKGTKDPYRLYADKLKGAKKDLIILHPLPRIDELNTDLDDTPYNKYFVEAYNCLIVRMALISMILGKEMR